MMSTDNIRMTEANLMQSFFGNLSFEYLVGTQTQTMTGAPSSWSGAVHSRRNNSITDRWRDGDRTFALSTEITPLVRPSDSPIFTMSDLFLTLEATYATPVPYLDWMGNSATRTTETIRLGTCPENNIITSDCIPRQHNVMLSNGRRIEIEHYWPPVPTGIVAGYTAPLHQWVQTRISGFTAQPIVLTGYYSQSYRPGHHNFTESFVFEPRLEAGIDPSVVAELEAQDIRLFHVRVGNDSRVKIMSLSGTFRDVR
jgi:hypothetical protein